MSAMLKTRRRSTAMTKPTRPVEETEAGPSGFSPHLQRMGSESEAPEDAIREVEPPEFSEEYHTEAPDAGQGDRHSIEREFTHGRSRS
jgi:hypothetical protein